MAYLPQYYSCQVSWYSCYIRSIYKRYPLFFGALITACLLSSSFKSLIYKTEGVSYMPQFPGSFSLICLEWGWNIEKNFDLLFLVLLAFIQYCNIILDTWIFLRLYISLLSIQEMVQFVFILIAIKTSADEFTGLIQINSAKTQKMLY